MQIERTCKHCKNKFFAQKRKQLFCSRKCFKQDYYYIKRAEALSHFPMYKCRDCKHLTQLTFDPSKNIKALTEFKCPWCYQKDLTIEVIIGSEIIFILI